MAEQVVYRQISVDTGQIPPGGRADATFFEASSPPLVDGSSRVTDLEEKPIVRWLMLDPLWRQLIWNELGLPSNAFYQPEVVQPFFAPGEAEFDLVACDPCRPDRALVIECKRVKVEVLNEERDRITKLHDVARGVSQANKALSPLGWDCVRATTSVAARSWRAARGRCRIGWRRPCGSRPRR